LLNLSASGLLRSPGRQLDGSPGIASEGAASEQTSASANAVIKTKVGEKRVEMIAPDARQEPVNTEK
jgi:hypothetical protein